MERLLAAFRKMCCEEGALAERVCSAGFLGQLLAAHTRAGGYDPRAASREQLLADGVALRCADCWSSRRAKAERGELQKPAGSFVHWLSKETKPQGLGRQGYIDWMRRKVVEFRELPQLQKDLNAQGSRCDFYQKKTTWTTHQTRCRDLQRPWRA